MAEARTFNFNEVAQPEEKDFQVANKMLFKEGYDSAKPPVNDTGARNVGDPQTPNPASPQKDFAPPGEQKIQGYPTPQIDLFDGKKDQAKPRSQENGQSLNLAPPKDGTPRIQVPETPKVAPDVPIPTPAPRAEQPKVEQPKAEQPKVAPVIPIPTPAPRAEQPKPTKPVVKEPEHPDPSKAKPFNKHTPKDGHSLAPGECIKGTASHYGKDDGLYGRKTASGERLRPGLATIALPHYNNQKEKPFQVVLHNTRTGQEIQARVNDMGPNLRLGRAADLESATFKRLFRNASGLAEITVCRPK
ncbi:MAG: hypothetical protein IPI39_05200 [Candidatus Obscuribacter sp.]|jgi:hypothetical protein|nr:hypothetical protein [Candidatus Obscuribacter sp.]MBK9621179.1 hypothetical protein [Candidatus Obscuribacter sp.]